jgi:hypothetical protein
MMQTYIEQVKTEPKEYIRERGALSRWLGLMPNVKNLEVPIMFKDKWMNFSSYLLQSMDFDFVMLDCLIVTLMDFAALNDSTL